MDIADEQCTCQPFNLYSKKIRSCLTLKPKSRKPPGAHDYRKQSRGSRPVTSVHCWLIVVVVVCHLFQFTQIFPALTSCAFSCSVTSTEPPDQRPSTWRLNQSLDLECNNPRSYQRNARPYRWCTLRPIHHRPRQRQPRPRLPTPSSVYFTFLQRFLARSPRMFGIMTRSEVATIASGIVRVMLGPENLHNGKACGGGGTYLTGRRRARWRGLL